LTYVDNAIRITKMTADKYVVSDIVNVRPSIVSDKMPSLLEALERKYGAKGEVNPSIDDMPVAIFVPKRSPRLSVPTLLVLNDCEIDCAGDARGLADKCADVVELDLANNKLTEWREVRYDIHGSEIRYFDFYLKSNENSI
jgi:hypothetical protein